MIEGGNIAHWKISIIEDEPAGYAIDNVSITPVQASILFREKADSEKDGTWGFIGDEIPGFDHSAFHMDNLIYESHPNYPPGIYVSEDGEESASISEINGVQAQHTKATFKHDATVPGSGNSPVIDFEEIPIGIELAEEMRDKIETQRAAGAQFQFIDIGSLQGIEATLSPAVQKEGGGAFTCVGLVEWAAEQAGHNGGQGFIRNVFESIPYLDLTVFPSRIREFPVLSPQLLNYAMKTTLTLETVRQWFQGIFDPVDFIITDPLGRRLGFTQALGRVNEMPKAFLSDDGKIEQFLIPNPAPGVYKIDLVGLNKQVIGAIASSLYQRGINILLSGGETQSIPFDVKLVAGSLGDVNGDGLLDG